MASRDLLHDDDVRRWFENLARGSELTADKNLRLLSRYCRLEKRPPPAIIEAYSRDRKAFIDRFMDFIEEQRNGVGNGGKPRAASYLKEYGVVLSSWVRHHGLDWPRGIKYGDTGATPTLQNERIPTKDQLRGILHRATPRARAIIALMAFSGLRPQVLGNGRGTDGLRLKDLADFTLKDSTVMVKRTPARIDVRRELSKTRNPYLTFLSEEGCEIVKAYLQIRSDGREKLNDESAVIRVTPGYETKGKRADSPNRDSPFLVTGNIRLGVSKAFGKAFRQRPYVLRSYFDTVLLYSRTKTDMPRDFRVFWMGHKGDMEHRYTVSKPLPPELIEAMREAYARAEPFMSTVALRQEGRPVATTDVSGEQYELTIPAPSERWVGVDDREKLAAFMAQILREDPLVKRALRDALID